MTWRILIAGICGGLAMFAMAVVVQFLPPAWSGVQAMPREGLITETLDSGVGGTGGFYAFPASSDAPATRPSGLLVFHIDNQRMATVPKFAAELGKDVVQGLLLAVLLAAATCARLPPRLSLAGAVGLLAALTGYGSYAIWFAFPLSHVLPQGAIAVFSYFLAGAVIAAVLPRRSTDRTLP